MVKGVARRVIMVKSPEPKLFEQAMFLVREEAFREGPPDKVLREAELIARHCLQGNRASSSRGDWLPLLLSFLCGGGISTILWLSFIGL